MTLIDKYTALICSLLIWAASPSSAELSVDQVWEDILQRTKSYGYKVSSIQSRSNGILVLSELNLRQDRLREGYSVNINLGNMQLIPNDDGSVTVSPSETISWDFLILDAELDTMTVKLIQKTKNLLIIAQGGVGEIRYDYSAELIDVMFDEFLVQGDMMKSDEANLRISLLDVVGQSKITGDALLESLFNFSTKNINFIASFSPKAEDYEGTWKTRLSNVTFASAGQVPDGISLHGLLQDVSPALTSGYNNSNLFGYEVGETDVSFEIGGHGFVLESSSAGGTVSNTISIAGIKSDSEVRSAKFEISGDLLYFPLKAELGSLLAGVNMPVMPRPEKQTFGVEFKLKELLVSQGVWTTFDPLSDLMHDPISVNLDIKGVMLLLMDVLGSDSSKVNLTDYSKIVQIVSLSLRSLTFSGFGVEVEAQSDFEFDNQDLKTFAGMPRPKGKASMKITGVNGFLEKAVKMGLIGSQQAMGVQMAIGMFALPVGNDMMQTEIEIDKNGGVFANGQRLR